MIEVSQVKTHKQILIQNHKWGDTPRQDAKIMKGIKDNNN